jgi:hypothetical protein
MEKTRYIISFIIIMLTIGINVGQHLLEQLNIDRNYLFITLIAITIAGLVAHSKLLFIVIICGLTLAANIPPEELMTRGVNPDVLFATLLAVILVPAGARLLR